MTERPLLPSMAWGGGKHAEDWLRAVFDRLVPIYELCLPGKGEIYVPGDVFWVQETWRYSRGEIAGREKFWKYTIKYQLDSAELTYERPNGLGLPKQRSQYPEENEIEYSEYLTGFWYAWQTPRALPRWASRITLEIATAVEEGGLWYIEFFRKEGFKQT